MHCRALQDARADSVPCLQKRRVLLAEDNLINQAFAREMLTMLGMACKTI